MTAKENKKFIKGRTTLTLTYLISISVCIVFQFLVLFKSLNHQFSEELCSFRGRRALKHITDQCWESCPLKAEAACYPLVKYLKPSCAAQIMQPSLKCSTRWPKSEAVSHADHKRPFSKMLLVLWLWLTFQWVLRSGFSLVENLVGFSYRSQSP